MRLFILRGFLFAMVAAALMLLAHPALAQQAPPPKPAAPVVTVGANLKELVFDWDPVPGAYTYWLMQKVGTNPHVYFTRVGERITGGRTRAAIPVAVHFQDWENLRYRVDACNTAGCTRSAEVYPRDLLLDTIGYMKASNTGASDRFGRVIALSADGSTLAVSAESESSNASGVNGNQNNNTSANSGAVYVYRRNGRTWKQEAYIKALFNEPQTFFGGGSPLGLNTLAISFDGSLLVIGAPMRSIAISGSSHEGTVFVYRRAANNSWSYLTHMVSPSPAGGDYFGYSVDMSQDGQLIKVSSMRPQELDNELQPVGHTFLFTRTGDSWTESASLAPYYSGDRCYTSRLNGNGTVLVSSCMSALTYEYRAVTLRLIGGAWVHMPDVPLDYFMARQPIAMDYLGKRLAINKGGGNDGGEAGAVVGLYRWENSRWVEEGGIGQPRFDLGASMSVGWAKALEFDRSGTVLAIGDATSPLPGAGVLYRIIGVDPPQGGVYLYDSQLGYWRVRLVKASNPANDDLFGTSVALSGNGRILAVGAIGEDSAARGIDGNRNDESAPESGAVYLY